MIRWLHISDLHMKKRMDADQQNVCMALLKDCKNRRIQADFVVATGDFHNFWDVGDYKEIREFLPELMMALGVDIEKNLFLVPGNHDIRDSVGAAVSKRTEAIQRFLESAIPAGQTFQEDLTDKDRDYARVITQQPELLQILLEAFQDYRNMASSLISVYGRDHEQPTDPAAVHVRVWNQKINLLHLNTALLSDGKRDHAEMVDISTACSKEIYAALDNGLPTLVLGHHSFHDLHYTIKERLVQLFNQTNVWAYLAGDRHRTNYQGDDYLIDRKINVDAWPNLVASKLIAAIDDDYSEIGAVEYCWDEKSAVIPTHLCWKHNGSGVGFTSLCRDSLRSFPMLADIDSKLYRDLQDRLAETRKNHPSFQLMEIDEKLFPQASLQLTHCLAIGEERKTRPLSEFFLESWSSEKHNHLMLEGEGGIGKTVALLSLTTQEGMLPRHVPAVYIPLYALKVKDTDDSIGRYLLEEILGGNRDQLQELISMANRTWKQGPRLVLLLDGFNEIPPEIRYIIARNVEEWASMSGVQVITASRYDARDFLPGLSGEYLTIKLQPLTRDVIEQHLNKTEVLVPDSDSALWEVINYPLMLTLYSQLERVRTMRSAIPLDWKTTENAGTIIWNYLQRELWRWQQQTRDIYSIMRCVLATEYIAPYIGWEMAENQLFIISEDIFIKKIKEALDHFRNLEKSMWPPHIQRVVRYCGGLGSLPDEDEIFDLLTHSLNLFRVRESADGPVVGLMHQRFRDCLAAVYLLNLICGITKSGVLPKKWRQSVAFYVMNFLAELITTEEADRLWEINRVTVPTDPDSTRTMLELQKRIRNYDFSELNFSGMDLRMVCLHAYKLPGEIALRLPDKARYMKDTQISPETFEPAGHKQEVFSIKITPDGKHFVSVSSDGTIQIWDMNTGACFRILKWQTESAKTIAVTSNYCISASGVQLRIWDINTGTILHTIEDHRSNINNITITQDGKYCVSASEDNIVRVWDINTGICLCKFKHEIGVTAMAVTMDGKRCVTAANDGTLRIWDMSTGKCLHTIEKYMSPAVVVAITPDGKRFISASDYVLRVWDMDTGEFLRILRRHTNDVQTIAITPDGHYCVTAEYHALRVWDINKGVCLHTMEGCVDGIYDVVISSNGDRCLNTSSNNVRIWDINTGSCLFTLKGHMSPVRALALTGDGNHCVSASTDGTLRVWDVRAGTCLYNINGLTNSISNVVIAPDGSCCIVAYSDDTLRVWDFNTASCRNILKRQEMVIKYFALDKIRCIVALSSGELQIWDINMGICLHTLKGHTDDIKDMAITLDEKYCISASADGTIQIWDMNTCTCQFILKGHTECVNSVVISSAGNRCVSTSSDGTMRVWDMNTGDCRFTINVDSLDMHIAAITPDEEYCVSYSLAYIYVWDLVSGKRVYTWQSKRSKHISHAVSVTADGKQCIGLTSKYVDTSKLEIWDMNSGKRIQNFKWAEKTMCIAIAPDGDFCVSISQSNSLRAIDLKTGQCLYNLSLPNAEVYYLKFIPGNKCLCSYGNDNLILLDLNARKILFDLNPIINLSLFGVDLTEAVITPSGYGETLQQNGALVLKDHS